MVKNLPAVQETWVRSLGWEDPLEKGLATHSSIVAWRIPWTQKPGGLLSVGSQRVGHDGETNSFAFTFFARVFYPHSLKKVVHHALITHFHMSLYTVV